MRRSLVIAVCLTVAAAVAPTTRAADPSIRSIAGTGAMGFSGDRKPARKAALSFPIDVERWGKNILVVDEANNRIRMIDPDGIITTVAGNGLDCAGHMPNQAGDPCGDLGKAKRARLTQPTGVAPYQGGFLIADLGGNVVRHVDKRGIIRTVAGTGVAANGANGIQATASALNRPARAVPTPDGGFLIAEVVGHRVRKVAPNGVISAAAGTGAQGGNGDNGAATAAQLDTPNGLAVRADGSYLISDSGNDKIRNVSAGGTITTFAGSGVAGSAGDGVAATTGQLNAPSDVAILRNGNVVIADTNSHLVKIVIGGTIYRLAGTPDDPGDGPNGNPYTTKLNTPFGVGSDRAGNVLIADHLTHRIKRVTLG